MLNEHVDKEIIASEYRLRQYPGGGVIMVQTASQPVTRLTRYKTVIEIHIPWNNDGR